MFRIFPKCSNFHFFDIPLRCKFESSGYGVSSTIQISSKFKFNPHPYLQARYLRRGRAPAVAYEKAARAAYGARDFAALKEVGQDARADGAGSKELTALLKEVAESGKSASGRAELRALILGGAV